MRSMSKNIYLFLCILAAGYETESEAKSELETKRTVM